MSLAKTVVINWLAAVVHSLVKKLLVKKFDILIKYYIDQDNK